MGDDEMLQTQLQSEIEQLQIQIDETIIERKELTDKYDIFKKGESTNNFELETLCTTNFEENETNKISQKQEQECQTEEEDLKFKVGAYEQLEEKNTLLMKENLELKEVKKLLEQEISNNKLELNKVREKIKQNMKTLTEYGKQIDRE